VKHRTEANARDPQAGNASCEGNRGGTSHALEKLKSLDPAAAIYAGELVRCVFKNFRWASGGSCGDNSIRLMIAAERPEPLWLALRMVQVVLRASSSALDCSSRVRNPASTRACPSSLIFAACRAFISATTGFLFFSCNEPSRDRPVVKPAPNSSVVLLKSASIAWLRTCRS
jgi:hypothetical protein